MCWCLTTLIKHPKSQHFPPCRLPPPPLAPPPHTQTHTTHSHPPLPCPLTLKTPYVYTGQGGNDLNGKKHQVKDQQLKGANRHMLVNLAQGLPVRLLRRNDDKDSSMGTSLVYDGLYDVVRVEGREGKQKGVVLLYCIRSRESEIQGGRKGGLDGGWLRAQGVAEVNE